jgi:hypothetical protein
MNMQEVRKITEISKDSSPASKGPRNQVRNSCWLEIISSFEKASFARPRNFVLNQACVWPITDCSVIVLRWLHYQQQQQQQQQRK